MKRTIKKVAVIGSELWFRNCLPFCQYWVEVPLLDIVPRELTDAEAKKGLTLSKVVRNRLVNEHLSNSLKSKPSPIYSQKFASRITTGNTTDDMAKIAKIDYRGSCGAFDIKKLVLNKLKNLESQELW
jgi:3-hydroxyacyl-CoA dehydrogenase